MLIRTQAKQSDGTMSTRDQLAAFAQKHGLAFTTIDALAAHRLKTEHLVKITGDRRVERGNTMWKRYDTVALPGLPSVTVFTKGDLSGAPTVEYVSTCDEANLLGLSSCSCQRDLDEAIRSLSRVQTGAIVLASQGGQCEPRAVSDRLFAVGLSALRELRSDVSAIRCSQIDGKAYSHWFGVDVLSEQVGSADHLLDGMTLPW